MKKKQLLWTDKETNGYMVFAVRGLGGVLLTCRKMPRCHSLWPALAIFKPDSRQLLKIYSPVDLAINMW